MALYFFGQQVPNTLQLSNTPELVKTAAAGMETMHIPKHKHVSK